MVWLMRVDNDVGGERRQEDCGASLWWTKTKTKTKTKTNAKTNSNPNTNTMLIGKEYRKILEQVSRAQLCMCFGTNSTFLL